MQKTSKKLLKRLNKVFSKSDFGKKSLLLTTSGLFLFFVGASHYYQLRILSFSGHVVASGTIQKGSLPTQITIPSVKIDEPIDVGTIKDGVWLISYDKPTFLDSSARPGTGGNIVIYGHNKKAIFGNLPYLSLGQKIVVKTADGKTHTYEAYWKDFVGKERIDLVSPENKEELTIYTCWGLFDSQRAVIKARPI